MGSAVPPSKSPRIANKKRQTFELDAVDRKIIAALMADARISVVDLGKSVGLSATPCLRRLRRLEEMGVITHYTAVIDLDALGLAVGAILRISLDRHTSEAINRFKNAVSNLSAVRWIISTQGDCDFIVRLIVPDLRTLNDCIIDEIGRIPHVGRITTNIILDDVTLLSNWVTDPNVGSLLPSLRGG